MDNELQLIRRVKKQNDKDAANTLVQSYYREIFAYVYRQTGEEELTKDLTQDIFYHMLRGIVGFDRTKAAFRTWLYRIARNCLTDYYRSRACQYQRVTDTIDEISLGTTDDFVPELLKKETVREAMEKLAQLEKTMISIFQLKWFEEKTFSEIGNILQIPESTAKTKYYQALKILREEMKANE